MLHLEIIVSRCSFLRAPDGGCEKAGLTTPSIFASCACWFQPQSLRWKLREAAFSLLKFVITVLRTGLREEQVNQLLFVHHHAPDAKDREGEMAFLRQVLAHGENRKKRKGLSNNLSDFKKLDEVKQKKRKVIQMTLASSAVHKREAFKVGAAGVGGSGSGSSSSASCC